MCARLVTAPSASPGGGAAGDLRRGQQEAVPHGQAQGPPGSGAGPRSGSGSGHASRRTRARTELQLHPLLEVGGAFAAGPGLPGGDPVDGHEPPAPAAVAEAQDVPGCASGEPGAVHGDRGHGAGRGRLSRGDQAQLGGRGDLALAVLLGVAAHHGGPRGHRPVRSLGPGRSIITRQRRPVASSAARRCTIIASQASGVSWAQLMRITCIPASRSLVDQLGRRREAYHQDVARARVVSDEELGNISAHDLVRATEEGLADKLAFDGYPRGMFVDHVLPAEANPHVLNGDYVPLADFANARHEIRRATQNGVGASAELGARIGAFALDKVLELKPSTIEARYRLENASRTPFTFCSQIDITLLSPESVGGRRIQIEGDGDIDPTPGTEGVATNVRSVRVACDDLGVDVRITPSRRAELWRLPIETVSQSERGFERSYQGTALVFAWRSDGSELDASLQVEVVA